MKTLFFKTTILLLLITLTSCEDNNPNPTNDSVGDDTFSCYVNGQLYTPTAGTSGFNGGYIRPFYWTYTNLNDPNTPMYFKINSLGEYTTSLVLVEPKLGENNLTEEPRDIVDFSYSGMIVKNERIFYSTKNNQNNGSVIFTELTDTKAVGTFECNLYNDKGDELKVTQGKFNLSLDSRTN